MKKLIGLVVILAVLVLGSYYGTGVITERKVRETVNVISQHNGIYVQLKDYQRGWFHSSAQLDWRLDIPERVVRAANGAQTVPAQRYEFSMPLTVDHGPVIFSDAGVKFGLGYAQTRMTLPEKYVQQFESLFTKDSTQPKLEFSQFINYLAKSRISLAVPAFQLVSAEGTGRLHWKGMDTSVSMTSDLSNIDGSFLVKGMDFSKDKMKTSLSEIKADYDVSKSSYGLYVGSASLSFPSLVVSTIDKRVFELDDVSLDSSSDISSGLLSSHLNLALKKLMLEEQQYGPGNVELAVRNLDAGAMSRINTLSMQLQNSDETQKQQLMMSMMAELPKLFSQGPELEIAQLEFTLPEGQITGNLLLSLPKSEGGNVMMLMQGVKGNAHLELPHAFVHLMLVDAIANKMMSDHVQQAMAQQSNQGALTFDEAKSQAEKMADQRIQAMIDTGTFVVRDQKLVVDMHLEGGQLLVNGKAFNPAMMKL
ncbi:MAG: YdgA family protein [Legionellaceae bacterium]|nr:YdgA family protein [Legionellaceae bacterium]